MNKYHNSNEALNNTNAESNVAEQEPQDIELKILREPEELENSDSYVLGYN